MKKTGVIVCSNAATDYLDFDYDIKVFRSVIILGDESYDDYTQMTAKEFYERLSSDKNVFPKTAFVSIGHMINTFESMKKQGYTDAFVITISSNLSGLYKAVRLAAEEVEDFEVHVFDSKNLAYPEAYMALEAARMFKEEKSIDEVYKRLEYLRDNNHYFFAVDTLEYLIKNGRLSKFVGAIAKMLLIRPVLEITKDGRVEVLEKARTSKKARDLMVKKFIDEIKDFAGEDITVFISHANQDEEVLNQIKNSVYLQRPDIKEIKCFYLTPVVGAHCGPKAMCLGWIKK